MKKLTLTISFIIFSQLFLFAQPGALDLSFPKDAIFGNGDTVAMITTNLSSGYDYGQAIAIQDDGKIIMSGYYPGASGSEFVLIRYNNDGSLDTSFDNDGIVTTDFDTGGDVIWAMALQSDGKIVVGGYNNNAGNRRKAVARYLSNGTIDSTFSSDGKALLNYGTGNTEIKSLAIQDDGKIIVAGYHNGGSTGNNFALTRLNTDGSLDNTFDTDGKVTTSFSNDNEVINSIAIHTDGKIVAVGTINVGSYTDIAVARYNTDGSLDNTFDTDGMLTSSPGTEWDYGQSVAIQTDGKIIVGGSSTLFFTLLRYNINGTLDATFDGDGIASTDFSGTGGCYSINIQTDGKIFASGYQGTLFNNTFAVARFNSDGTLDNTFSTDGKNIAQFDDESNCYTSAILNDGKIILGGYTKIASGNYSFALAKFNSDGSLENLASDGGKFTKNIDDGQERAYKLIVQPDEKVIIAGYDDIFNDNNFAVMRLNPDGTLDETFDTNGIALTDIYNDDEAYSAVLQDDGKIILVGQSQNPSNDWETTLVRYNPDGSLDNTFDTDGVVNTPRTSHAEWYDIALQDDGKIVVVSNYYDYYILRYNTDGSLDNTFDTDGVVMTDFGTVFDYATCVAIQTDGKIVVAGYVRNLANSNWYDIAVVRYNTDGSLDNTFDTDGIVITPMTGSDIANDIVIQNDGKILVTGRYGTDFDFIIMRYNTDGSLDNSFHADGKVFTDFGTSEAKGITIAPDGKILVTGSGDSEGTTDYAVARYNTDGTLDITFDGDGMLTTDFNGGTDIAWDIEVLPNGKIITGGHAATWSNYDFAITRYMDEPAIQASNITVSNQTENTADISWTNGCGDKRAVFVKEFQSGSFDSPEHTIDYNASSSFGIGQQIDASGWYCVYNDTGSSVTVSGLSTFTEYEVQVCEYFYRPVTFNPDTSIQNHTLFITDGTPTTQSSSIFQTAYTDSSISINWDPGNGIKRQVWITAGTAGTVALIDGDTYTANSTYGIGSELSGWYCIYDGSGVNATVTGLTPNTTYRLHICEYMDITTTKYLTSTETGNPSNLITDYAIPLTQASNIVFSGVSESGMTVSWTNGSGSSRAVFMRQGGSGMPAPETNTSYNANTNFRDGDQIASSGWYCIYNGSGTSVDVTGLTVSTLYPVMVCEYNGLGGTEKYNIDSVQLNPAEQRTYNYLPTSQTWGISADQITDSSVYLSWNNGDGMKRAVFVKEGDTGDALPEVNTYYASNMVFEQGDQIGASGWYCIYNGPGFGISIRGLKPNTTYRVMACEYNGPVDGERYLITTATQNPINFTTTTFKEEICMVTYDNEEGHNMIVWEKTPSKNINRYIVYRESTVLNQWDSIGNVPYDSLSVFIDIDSDPRVKAYMYKIQAVDINGIKSPQSYYHKTIHMQVSLGQFGYELEWTPYEHESAQITFTTIYIYRGTDVASMEVIDSLSTSSTTYTDVNYPAGDLLYQVGAFKPDDCAPNDKLKASNGPFSRALSNLEDNRQQGTSIKNPASGIQLQIFPNPMNESCTIRFNNPNNKSLSLSIVDITGKLVFKDELINTSTYILNKQNLNPGIYFIKIGGDRTKLIIQ